MDRFCSVIAFGNPQVPPSQPTFPPCPQLGASSASHKVWLHFSQELVGIRHHTGLGWPGSSLVEIEFYILVEAALANPDAGNPQQKEKGCYMRIWGIR